jgi:phosphatidate cytidylyltransferase
MLTRVITGVVAVIFFIVLVLLRNTIVLPIALGIISLIGVYEGLRAYGLLKSPYIFVPSLLFALSVFFASDLKMLFLSNVIIIYIYLLTSIFFEKNYSIGLNLQALFLTMFVPQSLYLVTYIMKISGGTAKLVFTCASAWVSDSLAQIIGSMIGKRKLCESISKNKTIEGSVAGLFGGLFCGVGFFVYMSVFEKISVNLFLYCAAGVLFSAISQLGDLVFSKIKRERGIKDYGNLLPGHGGVLDRLDSVLFLLPVAYLLVGVFFVL